MARCYKYWIALTDCDGFRIDTLKHIDQQSARNLCGTIKEFAAGLGKADFFLVGEVAGGNYDADLYLEILGSNLNATLDITEIRPTLTSVAKGLAPPSDYFAMTRAWDDDLGSHRNSGKRRVSILDDHDHVSGAKVRFSSDAASDHQVVAGVALQLFGRDLHTISGNAECGARWKQKAYESYKASLQQGEAYYLHYLVDLCCEMPGHQVEAIEYARADIVARSNFMTQGDMAWALYRAGQLHEAANWMELALASGMVSARLYLQAACIYSSLGEPELSCRYIGLARWANPQPGRAYLRNVRSTAAFIA